MSFWGIGVAFLAAAHSFAQDTGVDVELYKKVDALDLLKGQKPRPKIGKSFRTRLGLQIHPSCNEVVHKSFSGLTDEQINGVSQRWVEQSVKSVAGFCASTYPEVTPYLQDWVTTARRTVIICAKKKNDGSWAGRNMPAKINLKDVDKDIRKDFSEDLSDLSDYESLAKARKAIIELEPDTFKNAFESFSPNASESFRPRAESAAGTLSHEIFHSTAANNRGDHNKIESIAISNVKQCSDNMTMDRIVMLETLCSQRGDPSPEKVFFDRISMCGEKRGCTQLFTSAIKEDDPVIPTRGLPYKDAQSLCGRIYDRGYCFNVRKTQGDVLLKNNPKLVQLGKRIEERINEVFPDNDKAITAAYLAVATPGIVDGLNSFSATECYNAVLTKDPNGDLIVKGYTEGKEIKGSDRAKGQPVEVALARAIYYVSTLAVCQNDAGKRLGATLTQVKDELFKNLRASSGYSGVIGRRYEGKAESLFPQDIGSVMLEAAKHDDPKALYTQRLLGKELFNEYFATLYSERPSLQNEKFDCGPYKVRSALFDSRNGMKRVGKMNKSPAPQPCDEGKN